MTESHDLSPFQLAELPSAIAGYLSAQDDRLRRASAIEVFGSEAHVRDDGIDYRGSDAIRAWLTTVASEFTYTTTFIGQRHEGADRWVVVARLEGDFPGGIVELRYRFTLRDGLIDDLVIAP
ncbi:nuclear transport factor 2 family protein [Microbacterium sp. LWO12-1.2]|uniref:nuclear transport factor 2 family protein n=1 Tax=Microbacterium sp. LWO12-1.2 TaxID=3135261 RepID=UPI003429C564